MRVAAAPIPGPTSEWLRAAGRISRAGLQILEGLGSVRTSLRKAEADDERGRRAAGLQRILRQLCGSHGIEVRASGLVPEGPAVLVANHLSYVDPVLVASVVACVPVAKREIAGWPLLGAAARSLGVLFVDRSDAHSGATVLRESLRCLAAGVPVLCFPEGTTTRGETVLPFRRGVFGIARLAGVPIVPVSIAYDDPALCWTGDDAFVPHYLRTACRERTVARICFGPPQDACASASPEELAERARIAVVQMRL